MPSTIKVCVSRHAQAETLADSSRAASLHAVARACRRECQCTSSCTSHAASVSASAQAAPAPFVMLSRRFQSACCLLNSRWSTHMHGVYTTQDASDERLCKEASTIIYALMREQGPPKSYYSVARGMQQGRSKTSRRGALYAHLSAVSLATSLPPRVPLPPALAFPPPERQCGRYNGSAHFRSQNAASPD
jgi:hypothetical protein